MPTTTQKGYGWNHQQARTEALRNLRDGDLCSRYGEDPECPGPMYRGQLLELDHTDDKTAYRGLAHRACNRRAGALKRIGIHRESGPRWHSNSW